MIDWVVLWTFVPAALALNMTPGVDMMFCFGQGLRGGPRAALAASAGNSLGALVHVAIAGLGLGAAVAAMPGLFDAIRWVGVGYLLWLAWKAISGGAGPQATDTPPARAAFRSGLMVNLTNPKIILFVLAFIPQFVDPEAGQVLGQFLIFGALLGLGGFIVNSTVGIFAGGAGRRLTGSPRMARVLGYISGTIFAGLALRLAIMERA